MLHVYNGRPESIASINDLPPGPTPVFDLSKRFGADIYLHLLRSSGVQFLSPTQSVMLLMSHGLPKSRAWDLITRPVAKVRELFPGLVKEMEQARCFMPNWEWALINLPPSAVFLAADTLSDQFWDVVDRASGEYWIIGDPNRMTHVGEGYSRLRRGTNILTVPESVWPWVKGVMESHSKLSPGGPDICCGSLEEFRDSVAARGEYGEVITFSQQQMDGLPDFVDKPVFANSLFDTLVKTAVDIHLWGENGVLLQILGRTMIQMRDTNDQYCHLIDDVVKAEPGSRMVDLVDSPFGDVTLAQYATSPWRHRYIGESRIRAKSGFALTSSNHLAFAESWPWSEALTYRAYTSAWKTVVLLT